MIVKATDTFGAVGASDTDPQVAIHLPTTTSPATGVTPTPAVATRKVLHVINGQHYSGAERVQDLLAMALPQFGYDVGFACVKPDKFPGSRHASESPVFEVPMRHRLDFAAAREIVTIAREDGYQLVHAHTPRSLMVAARVASQLDVPLVYHVHSPVGRDSGRSFMNWVNQQMESWNLRRVDRMICVSKSLTNYMRELGHDPEKLRTVSNGVAIVDDLPTRKPPTTPWTIGVMALFRPRKGTEVLLEAMAILKGRGVHAQLRAVGPFETEDYEALIMKRATRLGIADSIEWTGFQSDVNEQLGRMDLFVLPSLYGEGLPMVVCESMANGVPVVAANVEGIPEAVRDGVDGLIFEPGSAVDLADKLESLIGDRKRWAEMRTASVARQRECLSDVNMARRLSEIYDELLG